MSLKKTFFPFYRVKKGETLKSISKKFGKDTVSLLLENNLSPKEIKEGLILNIKP